MSYLEIYNEDVRDLLGKNPEAKLEVCCTVLLTHTVHGVCCVFLGEWVVCDCFVESVRSCTLHVCLCTCMCVK